MGKTCKGKDNKVILQQQIPPRFPFEQRTRAELRFYRGMDYTKNASSIALVCTTFQPAPIICHAAHTARETINMYILQKYIIPKILRNLLLDIWTGGKVASRACALRKFFPEKTCQPVTICVIRLYMRSLISDGFGTQTRH